MSSSNVERIKERLDIVDVIGSYVKLDKAGRNYKAKSPFTNEKTPSFYVSPERQLYYCFSSGRGGDMFSFVQDIEGTDFKGALKILADRSGITLEYEDKENLDKRDELFGVIEKAKEFYERALPKDLEASDYVKGRGIEHKTIQEWGIGYAPNDWRRLREHLASLKADDSVMRQVGLIKDTESGKEPYDTFRDRIMFPIYDTSGRTIAFSGRILHKNDKAPKYLNSPDTVLFKKSQVLYGLHKAKTAIRRNDYAVLVEGQMDLVLSHQAGVTNTVASSGTAITADHLKRLKQLSNRIVISFDSDEAGFKAANRTAQLALSMGMEVKVVLMPDGKDPADIINKSVEQWRETLRQSRHIIDFYIDRLMARQIDQRNVAKEIAKNVLPYVAQLSSDTEKSHFTRRIAKETGLREDAIWEDLKRNSKSDKINLGQSEISTDVLKETPEDRITAIYHWQKNMKEPLVDVSDLEKRLTDIGGEKLLEDIKAKDPALLNRTLFEIEQYYGTTDILNKDIEELYKNLEIHILSKKKEALIPLIQKEDQKAIKEFNSISKKLEGLK